jgi:SAM-dependent methyltransferase
MKVSDPRGVGVWPKHLPEFTEEQRHVRDAFMARWLEVLPNRYGLIERFNHTYPVMENASGRTLEIGAGLGEHLRYEDLTHQDYYAVELREELVAAIRVHHPGVTAIAADCQQRLPFSDEYFDRVLAVHVLEHLPDLPPALDEIQRVLAPTGRLFVVIPCEGGLAYSVARRLSAQRMFEKEFGMKYEWLIRSEHVNVPWEILMELKKRFRLMGSRYFPFRIPSTAINLVIGLTLEPLSRSSDAPKPTR